MFAASRCRSSARWLSRRALFPIFATVLIASFGSRADAQTFTGPITSSTGAYTVTWSISCTSGSYFILYENTSTVYPMGCLTSKSFTGKPAASYTYHIQKCTERRGEDFCVGGPYGTVHSPHTVTVVTNGSNNVSAEPAILTATQHGAVPYVADTTSQGTVNIEIPIETLPGVTRETTPQLSIGFDSRSAASEKENKWSAPVLGYGWNLNGLTSIRRCEQRIVSAPALNFTSTDRLCLDGQLLVLAAGTYWSAGSEYRTERETFAKIVAQGSGTSQWFIVYTADGRTLRYGPTSGSRVAAGGTTVLYEWALAEVEDAWGNLLTITYHHDNAIGELYPLLISYGGYSVQFEYALRGGAIPQLNFGSERFARRTVYLHTIRTRANATLSREYRLNSNVENNVDLLKEFQSCGFDTGGNPQCMAKFTFNWFTGGVTRTVSSMTDNLGLQTSWGVSTNPQWHSSLPGFHGLPQTGCPTTTTLPPSSVASYYVWSMSKSDGTNVRSWSFWATGNMMLYSTENRGFLGLVETLRVDNQTGKRTYVGTHACFPYTGMTAAIYEYTAATNAGGQPLAKEEFFVAQAALGLAKFPYVQQRTALQYENGTNFGADQVNTQLTFSSNLLATQTVTRQIANSATLNSGTNLWSLNTPKKTEVTTTQFQNSTSPYWRVHFPSSTTTTHAATGEAAGFDQVETRTRYGNTLAPEYVTQHPATDTAHQVRFGYNTNGSINLIERSGAGFTTRTSYVNSYVDSRYPASVTNSASHTTTLTYDLQSGNPSSVTDPNLLVTNYAYDPFGRVVSIDFPDSRITTITYDNCSGCSAVESQPVGYRVAADPLSGPASATLFDRYGRAIRGTTEMLNGQWSNSDIAYDGRGRVLKRSSPYFAGGSVYWTNYTYDQLDRLTNETRPDGGSTGVAFSTDGSYRIVSLTESVTNPTESQYTYRHLNALGQLEINYDGTGAGQVRTDYDYSSNGWLDWTRVNSDAATVTSMTYDRAGNRRSITEPNTGTTTFDFDGLGQVLSQTDAGSRITSFAYDSLGRTTQRTDNGIANYWTYDSGYKALGHLSTRSTTNFSETYTYDSLSRPYTIATAITYDYGTANFQLTQVYDAYSRPTDRTFPSGFVQRSQYNSYGYGSAVSNTAYQTLHSVTAVNAFGDATTETFLNGKSETSGFDPATGRISSLTHTGLAGFDHVYTWRSNSILRQRTQGATTETFTYDQLNRLTVADTSNGRTLDYGYDNLGNLLYKTSDVATDVDTNSPGSPMVYGTGGAGPHGVRTATIGGVTHTLGYDAVGNVTSDTASSGNATFAYNARDLVTSITKNGITGTFKYDPDGQRFYKKSTSGDKHTFYLYGGLYQETRIGSAGTGYRKIQVSDAVQVTMNPSGIEETLYFRRDHLGSPDAILDGSGGIVDVLAYDPFGERRADTWASQVSSAALAEILTNEDMRSKRGFTDHEHLDEVGILHMNGRIYDPWLGRFLNADPIVQAPFYSQSYNRYAYTYNSPLSFVDPSGFEPDPRGRTDTLFPGDTRRTYDGTDARYRERGVGPRSPQGAKQVCQNIGYTTCAHMSPESATSVARAQGAFVLAGAAGAVVVAGGAVIANSAVLSTGLGTALAIDSLSEGLPPGGSLAARGTQYVYRGVHAGHPAIDAARAGRAVPGNVNGAVSTAEHNLGGVSAQSPFTSWTHDLDIAMHHATRAGEGGVLLRVPVGAPPAGATWSWARSPDVFGESEVLLRGVREGCTVMLCVR